MDPLLENFDDFVDDLLTSDIEILKLELDLLVIQHIFQSIYLDELNNVEYFEYSNNYSIAA